jgi:carbon-monoxide dehydrogenase medium subunit
MYTETNTRIVVPEFEFEKADSLAEMFSLMAEHGDGARLIAGGTDLIVQLKLERVKPTCVISLAGLKELEGVFSNGGLTIGSATKIQAVSKSGPVCGRYAALSEACEAFSTVPIMIMGTIGGNLCNASPAADTAPALLAFDAEVDLVTADGNRNIPLQEFFVGPGKTVLGKGEIMRSIRLPDPPAGVGSAFLKVSRVVADISQVCAAAMLVRDGERVADCRIALGSVAPTPVRARRAEEALIGRNGNPEAFEEAARLVAEDISPITDVRATEAYRRHVAAVIVRDALSTAWQRSKEGNGE